MAKKDADDIAWALKDGTPIEDIWSGKTLDPMWRKDFWRQQFCSDPDLRNDWDFWAEYVENDRSPIFEELRLFLGRILKGEERRPAQRPKNTRAKLSRDMTITCFVWKLEEAGTRPNEAVKKAVDHFRLDERHIRRVLAKYHPRAVQKRIDKRRAEIAGADI